MLVGEWEWMAMADEFRPPPPPPPVLLVPLHIYI
jgi:hypothetical protein